jgi:hypothetical protein
MPNFITRVCQAVFDTFVNAIKAIDTDHYYIHAGKKFLYLVDAVTIGTGATYAVSFFTQEDTKEMHWRPPIVSDSADKLTISLFEGDAYTGGSNGKSAVYNYLRKSSNTTGLQALSYGSTHVGGTKIYQDYIGGGTSVGGRSSGGETNQKEELVLKVNTKYTVLFSNASSGDNIVNAILNWYEEDVIS